METQVITYGSVGPDSVKTDGHALSILDFDHMDDISRYATDESECYKLLESYRWKDGIAVCPYCGCVHTYRRGDGRHKCAKCKKSFSVLQGTIFENSKISLRKWFMAIYYMSVHKKGISSLQLSKDIHVTQKTAWFMEQKIRTLFKQDDDVVLDDETVECDEMYAGGREFNKHEDKKTSGTQGRSYKRKTPVFGMVAYHYEYDDKGNRFAVCKAYAKVVHNCKGETLLPIIDKHIAPDTVVVTDTGKMYNHLLDYCDNCIEHQRVNHSEKHFGNADGYTTNHIEGFWGIFRRGVIGIYHYMSKRYLHRYVDEVAFRYNHKDMSVSDVARMLLAKAVGKVPYIKVLQIKSDTLAA